MRKISSNFTLLTAAAALMVAACGDDATGVTSGDELTSTEVAAVIATLGSAFESAGVAVQAPGAAPSLAAVSINENFDVSFSCESGTVELSGSMSGTVDDATFNTDVAMSATWDPHGCVVSDEVNTFTVDGAPRVTVTFDMTSTQDGLSISGTETGGFSFTSNDGRTGSCALDVTFSIVTTDQNITTNITGTVCGLDASGFATLGTSTST